MMPHRTSNSSILFFTSFFLLGLIEASIISKPEALASELRCFKNARLLDNPNNDGDSFFVEVENKQLLIRLYFVDCPEISANSSVDAQRVQEQLRYFGLDDPLLVVKYGDEAQKFTEDALSESFTVHTTFATAPGRSTEGRIYAFITTSKGQDLGEMLVESGLARVHGVGRTTPNGLSKKKRTQSLMICSRLPC